MPWLAFADSLRPRARQLNVASYSVGHVASRHPQSDDDVWGRGGFQTRPYSIFKTGRGLSRFGTPYQDMTSVMLPQVH